MRVGKVVLVEMFAGAIYLVLVTEITSTGFNGWFNTLERGIDPLDALNKAAIILKMRVTAKGPVGFFPWENVVNLTTKPLTKAWIGV